MAKYEEILQETLSVTDSAKAEVISRIDASTDIPDILKQTAKDFVLEKWDQLVIDEIIDAIPDEISEYLPVIKGIIAAVKILMALKY